MKRAAILLLRLAVPLAWCTPASSQLLFEQAPGGPESASVSLQRANDGLLYAVARDRLFRSADEGLNWSPLANPPAQPTAVATSGATIFLGSRAGLFTSSDGGETWATFEGSGGSALPLADIRYVLAMPDWILVSDGKLLYRSAPTAPDWSDVTPPSSSAARDIKSPVISGDTLCLALGDQGVHYSRDAGSTWAVATGHSGAGSFLAVSPQDENRVLVLGPGGSVRTSQDGCQSFAATGSAPSLGPPISAFGIDAENRRYVGYADGSLTPDSSSLEFLNGGSLPPETRIAIRSLVPVSGGMLAATDGSGVHFSPGTTEWTPRNSGLKAAQVRDLEVVAGGSGILVGLLGGALVTLDGGVTFNGGSPALRSVTAVEANGDLWLAAAGPPGPDEEPGLFQSTDGGLNWLRGGSRIPAGATIHSMTTDGVFFYASVIASEGRGVYRRSLDSNRWTLFREGLPGGGALAGGVQLAHRAGTVFGYIPGAGVYRTTDQGANWSPANEGLEGSFHGRVLATPGALLAQAGSSVYRSTNGGDNWTPVSSLAGHQINDMAEDAAGVLYLATAGSGLFVSTDGGASWSRSSDGLPRNMSCMYEPIRALVVDQAMIYAGLEQSGVFRSALLGTGTPSDAPCTPVDRTADPFGFAPVAGVEPGSLVRSGTITISGLAPGARVVVTVRDGEYSKDPACESGFFSSDGLAGNGDRLCVRHTAAATFGGMHTTVLAAGGMSAAFTSTVRPATDGVPDDFQFVDQQGVPLDLRVFAAPVLITGLELAVPVTILGPGGFLVVSGATSTCPRSGHVRSGSIANGSTLCVFHRSSTVPGGRIDTTITIGGKSDTFSSVTAGPPPDTTPEPFAFAPRSNVEPGNTLVSDPITVSGIDAPASISVSGGSYRIDDAPFTSATGTVAAGRQVRVRLTAPNLTGASSSATLTIGGVSATFTVTTRTGDRRQVTDPSGRTVMVRSSAGTLVNLSNTATRPAGAPTNLVYPNGFFSFDVTGLGIGAGITVELELPSGSAPTGYLKCAEGTCAPFPGVAIAGDRLTLTLRDGGAGDSDGAANGVIRDPGAPTRPAPSEPPPSGGSSDGGGTLGWGLLAPLLAGARRRRYPAVTRQ